MWERTGFRVGRPGRRSIGELVKQAIEGAIKEQVDNINNAAKDALNDATGIEDAIDAAKRIPDLLKEPYKIPLEILKFTAELGADVALFAGRVVNANDMYSVESCVQILQGDIL